MTRTIRVGGDTDTIASIAGQLAGTVVGSAGSPQPRIADIDEADELLLIASNFSEFLETTENGKTSNRR
jgi:ADP-ribosylglycohydrolase